MKPSPSAQRRPPPGAYFRSAIERAVGEGAEREQLILHLTLSDVSRLKRDASLAISDVSFAGGVMRFLGVAIEQGGTAESRLERKAEAPAA